MTMVYRWYKYAPQVVGNGNNNLTFVNNTIVQINPQLPYGEYGRCAPEQQLSLSLHCYATSHSLWMLIVY